MSLFDLPPTMRDAMRNAARDATISAARTFGFGGDTWTVQRPTGAGVGPKTMVSQSNVTALAFRQRPGGLAQALAGTPVLDDVWRLIVLAGALQPGDVITSVADVSYRFAVASIEPWFDYARCELERQR